MTLVILTIVKIWLFWGTLWLVGEWLNNWKAVFADQKGLKRHMRNVQENGAHPRVSIVISVIITYLFLGPFSVMLKRYKW